MRIKDFILSLFKPRVCEKCRILSSEVLYLQRFIDRLLLREGMAPINFPVSAKHVPDPVELERSAAIESGDIIPFGDRE